MAMLKKFSIILPPPKANAAKVLAYAKAVKTGMTTNAATFPDPTITMVDFGAKITALENSMVAKKYSSEATRELTKKIKEELQEMLDKLAAYVIGVAGTDRYIASLSGFQLSKEQSVAKQQTAITIKSILPGAVLGTTDIVIGDRGGSEMFKVYLKVGEDYVMHDAFTGRAYTLTDMPSGLTDICIIGFKGDEEGELVYTVAKAM